MSQESPPGKSGASLPRELVAGLGSLSPVHARFLQYLALCPEWVRPDALMALTAYRPRVEPSPWQQIRDVVMASLSSVQAGMLAQIDPDPLATTFFAEDHLALLADGRKVVVRILRPGANEAVVKAVGLDKVFFSSIQGFLRPQAPKRQEILQQFHAWALREMDFRAVLRDHQRQCRTYQASAIALAPSPVPELCTPQVYVTEYVAGEDTALEGRQGNADVAASNIVMLALRQALRDGHLNAALHTRLLRLDHARVLLHDFAFTSQLDEKLRKRLLRLLLALRHRDYDQSFIAFRSMFEATSHADAASFRLGFMGLSKSVEENGRPLNPSFWICEGMVIAQEQGFALPEAPYQALRGLVLAHFMADQIAPGRDRAEEIDYLDSLQLDFIADRFDADELGGKLARLHDLYFSASRGVNQLLEEQDEGRFALPVEIGDGPNTALSARKRARLIAMAILSIGLAWLLASTDLPSVMGWGLKWPLLGCLILLYAWIMLQTRRL